jgi:radical SAM-linked protein
MSQINLIATLAKLPRAAHFSGVELNSIHKDPAGILAAAIIFPDDYEQAMLDHDFLRMYVLLNQSAHQYWQRSFWPPLEAREILRTETNGIFTVETKTPLSQLDVLLFYISDILQYAHLVDLLEHAAIPALAENRPLADHPLIIACGPGLLNPQPLMGICDAFAWGEADAFYGDLAALAVGKRELDPGIFTAERGWWLRHNSSAKLYWQISPKLQSGLYPTALPIPFLPAAQQERHIEISRGTFNGRRSMAEDYLARPLRQRRVESIIAEIKQAFRQEGARSFALKCADLSEYTALPLLLKRLNALAKEYDIRFTLPGFVFANDEVALDVVRQLPRTRFSLPLYTAAQQLREQLNVKESLAAVTFAFDRLISLAWEHLSIKLLCGLPGENESHVVATSAWLRQQLQKHRAVKQLHVVIEVEPFYPQAHSPWQWEGMIGENEYHARVAMLRESLDDPRLAWRIGDYKSFRRRAQLSRLTLDSPAAGIPAALQQSADSRALAPLSLYDPLPWSVGEFPASTHFILQEREKSKQGKQTATCLIYRCYNCGLQRSSYSSVTNCYEQHAANPDFGRYEQVLSRFEKTGPSLTAFGRQTKRKRTSKDGPPRVLRLTYGVSGLATLLSHGDIGQIIVRTAARLGLPIIFSHGRTPKARLAHALPLPAGVPSRCELLEIETAPFSDTELIDRINRHLPAGLVLFEAEEIRREKALLLPNLSRVGYRLSSRLEDAASIDALVALINKARQAGNLTAKIAGEEQKLSDWWLDVETGKNHIDLYFRVRDMSSPRIDAVLDSILPAQIKTTIQIQRLHQQVNG